MPQQQDPSMIFVEHLRHMSEGALKDFRDEMKTEMKDLVKVQKDSEREYSERLKDILSAIGDLTVNVAEIGQAVKTTEERYNMQNRQIESYKTEFKQRVEKHEEEFKGELADIKSDIRVLAGRQADLEKSVEVNSKIANGVTKVGFTLFSVLLTAIVGQAILSHNQTQKSTAAMEVLTSVLKEQKKK